MRGLRLGVLGLAFSALALTGCGIGGGIDSGSEDEYSEELPLQEEKARKALQDVGATTGYEISLNYGYTESPFVYGRKGDIYWTYTENAKLAYRMEGTILDAYAFDSEENKWVFTYTVTATEDDIEHYSTLGFDTFYMGYFYSGMLKKNGSSTVNGRECDNYIYHSETMFGSVSMDFNISIDKQTGITMKYKVSEKVAGESYANEIEITEFKTSGIEVPDLPEPTEAPLVG